MIRRIARRYIYALVVESYPYERSPRLCKPSAGDPAIAPMRALSKTISLVYQ